MTQTMSEPRPFAPVFSRLPRQAREIIRTSLPEGLGWFSIGLGLAELFTPTLVGNLTGVRNESLLRLYGLRELVAGIGILQNPRPAGWMWSRVAGDICDLGTLLGATVENDGERGRAIAATVAVAGVTVLDTLCALELSESAR